MKLAEPALLDRLRRHPFPVVAWFERVVALSFAFPEEILRPLVPAGLTIDTYEGLGFVAVAMVWTKRLRPAGFPIFLGQDFFLAGYRVFTRLNDHGHRLRGLKDHSQRNRRLETCIHWCFSFVWLALTALFGVCAATQMAR